MRMSAVDAPVIYSSSKQVEGPDTYVVESAPMLSLYSSSSRIAVIIFVKDAGTSLLSAFF